MVCAPVWSIIPSLKLGDYLSVQAHKPCFISHIYHYKHRAMASKYYFLLSFWCLWHHVLNLHDAYGINICVTTDIVYM